jgi:site-specific recombinase XerD
MKSNDDEPAEGNASEPVGDSVSIFRRGRRWYANFQHGGKQHRPSLRTSSKKEARRQALQIEADLAAGRWKATPAAPIEQVIAAYRDFLRAEERAAKTINKYFKVFDRVAELARQRKVKDLSGVNLAFIDAYRQQRVEAGVKGKTRYTETVVIRQLVNFALSRNMLTTDPLKGLKLKKPRPTRQPCWTYEQLQQILAASAAEIKPALTILAETGMRFQELAWLTWDDVDVAANVLRIQPKEGWKPKSGDQRAIPLTTLKELVESLPRRWRWVVTMPPSPQHPRPGRQWTERRLLAALQRVLKKLKLPGKLHTFRHTFISNALLKGVSVAVVREWVGHVDEEVIKLYTHVHNEASQAAMRRLAEANKEGSKEGTAPPGPGSDLAQSQHKSKEAGNEHDAK